MNDRAAYLREYWLKNRKRLKAYRDQWRHEHSQTHRDYTKAWKLKNPEKVKECARIYYKKWYELHGKEYWRKYYEKNRLRIREATRKRRLKKKTPKSPPNVQ